MLGSAVPRSADPQLLANLPELSPTARRAYLAALKPLEWLLRPRFFGEECLPQDRPLLFVGNHQLLSIDVPFLVSALWQRDIPVRILADDFLFTWSSLAKGLLTAGALPASPDMADALLERKESLLVYPGGAREASKNTGFGYSLDWWDRLGFARLAIRHRCTVVPVAAIGVDDRVRILIAPERYLQSPLGTWVDRLKLRRDMFLPVMLPQRMPRPMYRFCPPIHTDRFAYIDAETAARRLRSDAAAAIDTGLKQLRAEAAAIHS